jgi:cell division protein FtsZ
MPQYQPQQDRSRLSERLAGLATMPSAAAPVDLDEPSLVLGASEMVKEPSVWRAPGNVTIEKRPAQMTGIALPRAASPQAPAAPQRSFQPAPPAAIRRPVRRMPNVEELPVVAQNEIKAKSGQSPQFGLAAQKRKVGFLERLANVGRGRKEPDAEMPAKREPEFGQPRSEFGLARPMPAEASKAQAPAPKGVRIERPRGDGPVASVPKRIEAQPRVATAEIGEAPAESHIEDDLEIPAFLRRRAN